MRATESDSSEIAADIRNAEIPTDMANVAVQNFATDFGDDKKATATKIGDTRIPGRPQIP